jgi:hypothetical protein
MVHGRNRQRHLLNRLAQKILAADGAVDMTQAVTTSDGRRLAVGDDVIARHGDRRLHPPQQPSSWMRNGTTGRILAIQPGRVANDDRIVIQTADGLVDCPRRFFDRRRGGIDLAYAVTSYAVQGSTRSASTSAVTATTTRSELYVDITRGRDSNQLYASRPVVDGDNEHHLPTIEVDTIATLRQRLARGTGRTALGTDPTALDVATTRARRTLRSLLAASRRGGQRPALEGAVKRTIDAIRRQARSAPPPGIGILLPPRPACPHLAKRWDTAVGEVAVHQATSEPLRRNPPSTARAIERLLGPQPDDDDGRERWDRLAGRLARLAAEITIRTLNDRASHLAPLSDEHIPALLRLALDGHLGANDDASLDRLAAHLSPVPGNRRPAAGFDQPADRSPRPLREAKTVSRSQRRRHGRDVS